jgi:hypothetical protein
MDQERLEKIKAAWMKRYGTTEEQWDNFSQQTPYNVATEVKRYGDHHEFDSYDDVAAKMEFIFCPDEREMGMRFRSKSDHFRRLADKLSHENPVQAKQYRDEARFWDTMSKDAFQKAQDNRRKL